MITKLQLIAHIYGQYTRISATDLTANYVNLWKQFNPDETLKSLYMNINKCVDYATVADKPITEGQVMRIKYGLVSETW